MSRIPAEYSPENIVRNWASLRGKVPFTSAQAFEEVKDIDDIKAVSDALVRLFRKGLVGRRKIDGQRYQYIWHAFAGDGFELYPDVPAPKEKPLPTGEKSRREGADPVIPAFLRKGSAADAPSPQPSPARGEGGPGPSPEPAASAFDSEAIAEALIRKLKPVLQAQFANHALESTDVLTEPCSRVTLRIEKLELTVEGLL